MILNIHNLWCIHLVQIKHVVVCLTAGDGSDCVEDRKTSGDGNDRKTSCDGKDRTVSSETQCDTIALDQLHLVEGPDTTDSAVRPLHIVWPHRW